MSQLQPNRSKFEVAKIGIKQFSENLPHTPSLNKFEEEAFFGLISKNVTGGDMNKFVAQAQRIFTATNASVIKLFKAFNEVYNVLEILDKEYVGYFQSSIDNLKLVNSKVQDAQKDIDSTLKVLKATIENLKEFKNKTLIQLENIELQLNSFEVYINTKLDQLNKIEEIKASIEKYKHFMDIDDMWEDIKSHKSDINSLLETTKSISTDLVSFKKHVNRIEQLNHIDDIDKTWSQVQKHSSEIKSILENLYSLNFLKKKIEGLVHISDIDDMWNSLEKIKIDISNIYSNLNAQNAKIQSLNQHKEQMSAITHLKDVDQLWLDNQSLQKEIIDAKKSHQQLEQKSNESILNLVEKNRVLEELIQNNQIKSNSKISYAYIVGGLALLLIILKFGLDFSK